MNMAPDQILQKVRSVSNDFRQYRESADTAHRQYGIPASLLATLVDAGLPTVQKEGEQYFDPFDLSNISLHLKLPSVQRMAMRTWSRTLGMVASGLPHQATIELNTEMATTPQLAHQPLRLTLGETHLDALAQSTVAQQLVAVLENHLFFMLPEGCRWNVPFLQANAISECGGASKLLVETARHVGLSARHCFGILVAAPFSTGHFWAELNIDGRWVAFDPQLIKLLCQTTRLDPTQWPLHRSPGGAFHRLLIIERYDVNGAPVLEGYADVPYLSNIVRVQDNVIMPLSLATKIDCDVTAPG